MSSQPSRPNQQQRHGRSGKDESLQRGKCSTCRVLSRFINLPDGIEACSIADDRSRSLLRHESSPDSVHTYTLFV